VSAAHQQVEEERTCIHTYAGYTAHAGIPALRSHCASAYVAHTLSASKTKCASDSAVLRSNSAAGMLLRSPATESSSLPGTARQLAGARAPSVVVFRAPLPMPQAVNVWFLS
jgi:hypothetical protein